MADRLKRAPRVRLLVALAVLAFPLLAVGTAQAAVAFAPAEQTSNRPDLLSATAISSNSVDFCFDKVLNNPGFAGTNFALGGYRAGRWVQAASAFLEQTVDHSGKCVRAIFTSGNAGTGNTPPPQQIGDIGQYTVGEVTAGAVQTTAAIANPNVDSVALTVPASLNPTHNGTTGFTAGPDLTNVLVDPTTNTITYVFDQNVSTTAAPLFGNFYFTRSGGTQCFGAAAPVVSDNMVTIAFAPVGTCPVSDAQRAGTTAGALPGGAAADPGNPSTPSGVIVPASATSTGTGTTAAPDLTKVVVDPTDKSSLDFTFDKAVSVVTQTGFHAVVSISGSGAVFPSTTASVIATSTTSTTIKASFALMSQFSEYVVKGAVDAGAVTETSPPHLANVIDAAPSGGNAGAFSRGFTTGPDVLSGIIHTTTGVLSLNVDQRVLPGLVVPASLRLVDGTGVDVTPLGSSGITVPTQGPGPETIQAQFSPGQASVAHNAALISGASPFTGGLTIATALVQPNVPQVLHITSTASILHGLKHAKKQSAAFVRKVNARSRAKNRAAVARLIRRHH